MSMDAIRAAAGEKRVSLATILEVEGSTPRGVGARMAVFSDGHIAGTVGGGKVEALAIERARESLVSGTPSVLTIDLTGSEALGEAMICGGRVLLVVEPVLDRRLFLSVVSKVDSGRAAILVTEGGRGSVAALDEFGAVLYSLDPGRDYDLTAAAAAFSYGLARVGALDKLLYEAFAPQEKLLVLGAGHVGRALADLASRVGFSVTVGDPRSELADPERFARGVELETLPFESIIEAFDFGPAVYAVVVSPGHLSDIDCLRALLKKSYRYVGFIGSRRKVRMVLASLKAEGFDPERVDALFGPIGLDIGAQTPEEIAVAILAELVAVRRNAACLSILAAERLQRRAAK